MDDIEFIDTLHKQHLLNVLDWYMKNRMDQAQAAAVVMYLMDDEPLEKIGEELGVSDIDAADLVKGGLAKLKGFSASWKLFN